MTSLPMDPQLTVAADPDEKPVKTYPRWPVLVLAASAFVAIWGGWVSLGRMCGFGPVNLLPGITDFQVDLSITLPLGMEVYAAYATGAWLSNRSIDHGTRMFAKWSSLMALFIGGAGQVTYHLLNAAHVEHAPTPVVSVVSCIPVVVLGMASQLAYRLTKHTKSVAPAMAPAPRVAVAQASTAGPDVVPAEPEQVTGPAVARAASGAPGEQTVEVEESGSRGDGNADPENADPENETSDAENPDAENPDAENPDAENTAQLDVRQRLDEGIEHTLQLDMEPHIGSMFYDPAADRAVPAGAEYAPYDESGYGSTGDIWSQIDVGENVVDASRAQYLRPDLDRDDAADAPADVFQDRAADDSQPDDVEDQYVEEQADDGEAAVGDHGPRSARRNSRGPLSDEERSRILELVGDGHSEREVSRKVGRSRATVHRVVTSEQQEDDATEGRVREDELELASAG